MPGRPSLFSDRSKKHKLGRGLGLVVLMINVAIIIYRLYRDVEARDIKSLQSKLQDSDLNTGLSVPQAKSLTTRPFPLLLK